MQSICSYFSYSSSQSWSLWYGVGVGGGEGQLLLPHSHFLVFSQWCLIFKQLLVVLIWGSKFRNNLCHHLGDVSLRLDLKCSHHNKEMVLWDPINVVANAILVIILQYIIISNQWVLYLKHMQNYISKKSPSLTVHSYLFTFNYLLKRLLMTHYF